MIKNINLVECNVIGAIIRNGELIDEISYTISKSDFSSTLNGEIFETALSIVEAGEKVDIVTLSTAYESKYNRDIMYQLGDYAKNSTGKANIKHYAKLIKDNSIEIKLLQYGQEIINISDSSVSTSDKINEAQNLIMGISEKTDSNGLQDAKSLILCHGEEIQKRSDSGGLMGLETGIKKLDDMSGGLHKGDLIIVAGRPSMGKTTFAMNLAENCLFGSKPASGQVLMFSLEMPAIQLLDRSISSVGRINFKRLRNAKLTDDEWNKMLPISAKIAESKLFIDETAGISVGDIRSKARKQKRKDKISLIVIDYIQLMDYGGENDLQAITKITSQLKALAKENDCPVIALSQLNRSVEQRSDKRPLLSDLRSSGSIEQDADMVMFMYRDEYYNKQSNFTGIAELIIAKQRNGETGSIPLKTRLDQMRFENYEGEMPEEETRHYAKTGMDY